MSNSALLTGEESLAEVRETIEQNASVQLQMAALRRLLERCQSGVLSPGNLGLIADELERETVVFAEGKEKEIATVIHKLSSPELDAPIDSARCTELMRDLDQGLNPHP